MLKLRIVTIILISTVVIGLSVINAGAANYSLYANLSPSDSVASNLIGLYLNLEKYDPYNEYLCCRTGQYDYYLFYGPVINDAYDYIHYYGVNTNNYITWQYEYGSGTNLVINSRGFYGTGNVPGTVLSDRASQFGFGYVITVLSILGTILLLFKTFRRSYRLSSQRGYTLK